MTPKYPNDNDNTITNPPSDNGSDPFIGLDVLIAGISFDIASISASIYSDTDKAVEDIAETVADVISAIIAEIDRLISEIDFELASAYGRIDSAINAALYTAWLAAYHVGADVTLDGFPDNAYPDFLADVNSKRDKQKPDSGSIQSGIPGDSGPHFPPPAKRSGTVKTGIPKYQPDSTTDNTVSIVPGYNSQCEIIDRSTTEGELAYMACKQRENICLDNALAPMECYAAPPIDFKPPLIRDNDGSKDSVIDTFHPDRDGEDDDGKDKCVQVLSCPVDMECKPIVAVQEKPVDKTCPIDVIPCYDERPWTNRPDCEKPCEISCNITVDYFPLAVGEIVGFNLDKTLIGDADSSNSVVWTKPIFELKGLAQWSHNAIEKDGWFKRLNKIEPLIIEFGKEFIRQKDCSTKPWILEQSSLTLLLKTFHDKNGTWDIVTNINTSWEGYLSEWFITIVDKWVKDIELISPFRKEGWYEVSAVRAFFTGVVNSEIGTDRINSKGRDTRSGNQKGISSAVGPSTPIGTFQAASGDFSMDFNNGSWTHLSNNRISIKPLLIPMIACCDYLLNRIERMQTLTVHDALTCYFNGGLDVHQLYEYAAIQSMPEAETTALRYSGRTKPNIGEAIRLHRRGLTDRTYLNYMLGENGVIQSHEKEMLYKLSEYDPPVDDIIRFMVRDVEDRNVVDTFKLDQEFTEKFTGTLPQKANAVGITEETARLYWRAHWRLPGLHQVYECLHRLREGSKSPEGEDIHTSIDHVRLLLAQDDVIPFWRDRLIAISYNPLTRVDVMRMHVIGVLNVNDLVDKFQDAGYNKANAELLAQFTGYRRFNTLLGNKVCKQYTIGLVGQDEVKRQLDRFKTTQDEYTEIFRRLDIERKGKVGAACIKALRKRYLTGGISADDARQELFDRGVPAAQVNSYMDSWNCEKAIIERQPTATVLCKWFAENLITEDDFTGRLIRLGYNRVDAAKIVATCKSGPVKRIKNKEAKDKERALLDLDKLKERERIEQERKDSLAIRIERQRDREIAALARRKAKVRKATEKYADVLGIDISTATEIVSDEIAYLISQYALIEQEAELLILDVLKVHSLQSDLTLRQTVDVYARADEKYDENIGEAIAANEE